MRLHGITKRVEGQILVIVISISAIAALLLSGVSILLSSSFSATITSANTSLDQNQAVSAVNYLTTELNNQMTASAAVNLLNLGFTSSGAPIALSSSYGANASEQVYLQNGWQSFNSLGQNVSCPTTGASYSVGPCYYIKLKAYSSSNVAGGYGTNASLQSLTAEIVEGRNCLPSSTGLFGKSCKNVDYYSSNISANNYYNYLYFTNYETLAPRFYQAIAGGADPNVANGTDACQADNTLTGCIPVSYESDYVATAGQSSFGDTLNGAIRTNSQKVFTCVGATASFNVPVIEATSTTPVDDKQCDAIPTSTTARTVQKINFPSSVSSLAQIAYPYWFPAGTSIELLPNGGVYLKFQVSPSDSTYYSFWQSVLASLLNSNGDQVQTTTDASTGAINVTATMPIPPNGVIYTTGNLSNLVGVLSGQLTVVANGDISIASSPATQSPSAGQNLYYNCAYSSTNATSIPSGCTDMLGVVSQGDISIGSSSTSPIAPSVTVDAALTALGPSGGSNSTSGTIYAANWQDTQNSTCLSQLSSALSPTQNNFININGALVAQYRGVFGEYNQSSVSGNNNTPCLLSGYYKNFTWDARLAHNQPPYSYSPSSASFVSLGVRHVFNIS